MLFLSLMSLKIAITDFKTKKILNHDLTLILIVAILHHHKFQYRYAVIALIVGLIFSKFLGAGDIKFFALIVLLKPNLHSTVNSMTYIAIGAAILSIGYFIKYRNLKMRIPLGPALCIGLLF